MLRFFNIIVYMSWISVFVMLFLMGLRYIIGRKLPARVSYVLWGILLFRLIIPISFTSEVSLFNWYPITAVQQLVDKELDGSRVEGNNIVMENMLMLQTDTNKIYDVIPWIWLVGVISLMGVSIIAYIYMANKWREATLCRGVMIDEESEAFLKKEKINIYSIEGLKTPVVCGILKPRIIVPTNLTNRDNKNMINHVIRHEIVHIRRKDYLIKLIALFVTYLHWFNPIIWVGLMLFYQDMEIACDEKVVQEMPLNLRKEYAQALLSFTIQKPMKKNIAVVAFGESNTKKRIKGVLKYKKPSIKRKVLSYVVCIVSVFLIATNASIKIYSLDLQELKLQRQELWIDLDEISKHIIATAIVSQDKNFDSHNGIDITAMLRAAANNLDDSMQKQGGSTITQQLVKNLCDYEKTSKITKKRSEIYTALELEKNHNKEEIIEAYLNSITFGNGIIGIKEACRIYFDKLPSEVTRQEAAQLIAIIDNPNRYDPITQKENNKERAQMILDRLDAMMNN